MPTYSKSQIVSTKIDTNGALTSPGTALLYTVPANTNGLANISVATNGSGSGIAGFIQVDGADLFPFGTLGANAQVFIAAGLALGPASTITLHVTAITGGSVAAFVSGSTVINYP